MDAKRRDVSAICAATSSSGQMAGGGCCKGRGCDEQTWLRRLNTSCCCGLHSNLPYNHITRQQQAFTPCTPQLGVHSKAYFSSSSNVASDTPSLNECMSPAAFLCHSFRLRSSGEKLWSCSYFVQSAAVKQFLTGSVSA